MRSKLGSWILQGLLSMVLCGCHTGSNSDPTVDVTATIENGQVVFHLSHSGINGILAVVIEDANAKPIWHVRTNGQPLESLVFGEVPKFKYSTGKQMFPANNEQPADIRGKTVVMRIDYQYDVGFAAASSVLRAVQVPGQ